MKLKDIEQKLTTWYAMSAEPNGPAVYLVGPPGRGKTTVLETLPKRLEAANPGKNFGLVVLNGACVSLTTVSGYLWPTEVEGVAYSRFTKPDWYITREGKSLDEYDGGVILVDEADKVAPDEKKILGEAALSKRLASHWLPPGWVVWFAGNSAKDRSGSTKEFDHLINRRMEISVSDDLESLTNWMEKQGCLAESITFASENPNIVFPDKPQEVQGPFCTPRSLASMDRYLRFIMQDKQLKDVPTGPDVLEECSGIVGEGAVTQFMTVVRLGQELPAYEKIVAEAGTIPVPKRPDAQMLAVYKLAARVSEKDIAPALTYIKRLPKEFSVTFLRTVTARVPKIISTPPVVQWCKENSALVVMLAKLKAQ
jgi:hypothetical protein